MDSMEYKKAKLGVRPYLMGWLLQAGQFLSDIHYVMTSDWLARTGGAPRKAGLFQLGHPG
jgi:hypothetical protein